MTKLVFTLIAAAAVAAPALAADVSYSFERDGTRFNVTETVREGVRYIDGVDVRGNRPFHLRVKNGWVDGDFAGSSVSYAAPKSARLDQTASR